MYRKQTILTTCLSAGLLCWWVGASFALNGKGRVVGFVKDQSGAPLVGAGLLIRGEGVLEDTRTLKSGVYELEWFPPGTYRVECHVKGCPVHVREGVKIVADKDTRLDWRIPVGERATGEVVAANGESVKLKTSDGEATFSVPPKSKLAALEASQLNPGDRVTVTYVLDGDGKFVVDIEGRGTVVGKITGLGDRWIEVTPVGGKAQRFTPRWTGGSPANGGGFEKSMLALLGRQKVGAQVVLTWEMPEGKRVVDIQPAK